MSDPSTTTGQVLGVTTGVAGVAILPNTGGNPLLTAFSVICIVAGTLIVSSFVVTRFASKFMR